jgi:hypothetical protein
MHRVAAKFVPRLLTEDQRERCVAVCQELLDRANEDENFMNCITTGDKTWAYGYDVETKAQSSLWVSKTSPRPKKVRQVRSNVKAMLTCFFYVEIVVHHEFLPQGQAVNRWHYLDVFKRLRESIRRKRPQLWRNNSWILHHDNAPAHASLLIRYFLAKH